MIYLSNKPTKGKVKIFNKDINNLTREDLANMRRKIGVVFQDYRLLNHMNVFDNVALPLRVTGKKEKYIKTHVPELLEWVGLGSHIKSLPPTLSGGQKQRVAIARAVINKPDILLADEPTGNVDEEMGLKLMHLFVELNKVGTCVIIATHNKKLIETFNFPRIQINKGYLYTV
jgi:cell division transport system ATP-binding protein